MKEKKKSKKAVELQTVSTQDAIIALAQNGKLHKIVEEASIVALKKGIEAFKIAYSLSIEDSMKKAMAKAALTEAQHEMFPMTKEERETACKKLKKEATKKKTTLVSIKEALAITFVPEKIIRAAIKSGELTSKKLANKIFIDRKQYEEWARKQHAGL